MPGLQHAPKAILLLAVERNANHLHNHLQFIVQSGALRVSTSPAAGFCHENRPLRPAAVAGRDSRLLRAMILILRGRAYRSYSEMDVLSSPLSLKYLPLKSLAFSTQAGTSLRSPRNLLLASARPSTGCGRRYGSGEAPGSGWTGSVSTGERGRRLNR